MRVCFFFFFFPPDWGYITVASFPSSFSGASEGTSDTFDTDQSLFAPSERSPLWSVPPTLSRVLIAPQWLQSNKLWRKIWGMELDRYSRCLNDCCLLLSILVPRKIVQVTSRKQLFAPCNLVSVATFFRSMAGSEK